MKFKKELLIIRYLKTIGRILCLSIFFFTNCSVSEPKSECEEILRVFNFQATYSFGQACIYPTFSNDPENQRRCEVLALLNANCKNKKEIIYKLDLNLDLDGSQRKRKEQTSGQMNSLLAILYAGEVIENSFTNHKGESFTNLLEDLITQRFNKNTPDGIEQNISCNQSGTAITNYFQREFFLRLENCQHKKIGNPASTLLWNGEIQGPLSYKKYTTTYYLDRVSMQGDLNYSGSISSYIWGTREIKESCRVSISYSFPNGYYQFCGRNSSN